MFFQLSYCSPQLAASSHNRDMLKMTGFLPLWVLEHRHRMMPCLSRQYTSPQLHNSTEFSDPARLHQCKQVFGAGSLCVEINLSQILHMF